MTPLHPLIGAQVSGIDLSQDLDAATIAEIKQAWSDYSLLLFRDQDMSDDDQLRLAAHFGPIATRVTPPAGIELDGPDWTNIMLITDRKDATGEALGALGHGDMWFHSDKCYRPKPHRVSFLYGIEIPNEGGHTKFSSLYSAYENMSSALKERLDEAFVMQGYDYGNTRRIDPNVNLEDILHHRQPMIVTNPSSGRKALYIARLNTMWIEGMGRNESEEILAELFGLTERDDNYYEHVWRPGDLVMWDNLACLHARTDWPDDQSRQLRRCTVEGERLWTE
ncbi:TauD/TfdA family dioxygenase [Alphaproteobacteria bacterium]|nr:TauD/TfdA family dioxygenase [Alphaproteobacteria bacterium]